MVIQFFRAYALRELYNAALLVSQLWDNFLRSISEINKR